jgi:hypothetical protein
MDDAQEIGSPYNRRKDALMASDDDERHSSFRSRRPEPLQKQMPFHQSLAASPMRQLINLQPVTESSTANVPPFRT